MARPSFVLGQKVIDALKESGIADDNTRRVVLDIDVTGLVVAYVEKYADTRVIQVAEAIGSVGVRYADASESENQEGLHTGGVVPGAPGTERLVTLEPPDYIIPAAELP